MSEKKLPLPERLRELRLALGWTQQDVVNELKTRVGIVIRPNHLSNCEQGVKSPSLPLLAGLATVLETSTDYLLGLTDNRSSVRAIEASVQVGGTGGQLNQVIARLPRDKQDELLSVAEAYIYRDMMSMLLNEIEEIGGDAAVNNALDRLDASLPNLSRHARLASGRGATT